MPSVKNALIDPKSPGMCAKPVSKFWINMQTVFCVSPRLGRGGGIDAVDAQGVGHVLQLGQLLLGDEVLHGFWSVGERARERVRTWKKQRPQ